MSYSESLAVVIYGPVFLAFLWWYFWCLFTIVFVAQRPSDFFSESYPTSSLFLVVNLFAAIFAAAYVLMKLTN